MSDTLQNVRDTINSAFLGLCVPLQVDCNNYIRLLEFLDDRRIYVCGTYAFDPQCAFVVSVCVCVCSGDPP